MSKSPIKTEVIDAPIKKVRKAPEGAKPAQAIVAAREDAARLAQVPAVMANGASSLQMLERIASDPNFSIEKMNAFIDANERIMDRQAEINFNVDMAALRKELNDHPIVKNKDNNQTKSKYADLHAIKKVADPLLSKYGFYDRYEDEFPTPTSVITTCEIVHRDGHSKKNRVQFTIDDVGIAGSKNKTAIHGMASSMTYGQRLSFCRAMGIRIAEDDDGNGAGGVLTITTEEAAEIDNRIRQPGHDMAKFLAYMKVDKVQDILAKDHKKALVMIEEREKALAKKAKSQTINHNEA